MLSRQLEPEVMDSADEARVYDAMDHAEVNRRFADDLFHFWQPTPRSGAEWADLLDLGTGTARIPVELCLRCEDLRVMAVDAAAHMLDLARLNIEVAGLLGRVQLEKADAKQLPYPEAMFDAVVSNSLVHHLPEPRPMLAEAVRVVRPGGVLFFRDLIRPPDDAAVKRIVHQHAGQETPEQQQLLDDSLRAALSLGEIRELVASLGHDPKSVRTTSDRHWTWAVRV